MGYEYIDQRLSMNDETDNISTYLMDAAEETKQASKCQVQQFHNGRLMLIKKTTLFTEES
jgi:hypothetical protein